MNLCLLYVRVTEYIICSWTVVMTTLDDKILGEKPQYYYSSSEDEGSDDDEGENKIIRDGNAEEPEIDYSADGSSVNTGGSMQLYSHLLHFA